ncbi:MAG: sialidase family protein [Kofleriaceae bacterium]|nr:sialidase family protein [Kofleriaceae bacterium]
MTAALVLVCMALTAGGWEPPVEIAQGGGERGPWRQNDSRFDHVDDGSVAFAPDGATIVAWVDHWPKDVFVQVFEPTGARRFTSPINISRTPEEFSWLPRIAVSSAHPDDIYVLWQEIIFSGGPHGGDILFAQSRDGGRTFSAPQNLSHSIHGDGKGRIDRDTWQNGSLDLAVAPNGTLLAAWTDYEGHLWFTRSTNRGTSFAAPRVIVHDRARPARAPALAATRDRIYLAWSTGEDAGADVRVATSRDGGRTFGAPVRVAHSPAFSDAPKLAVDRRGTLHIVYADGDDIMYVRSQDGRQFSAPRVLSRPRPTATVRASFPSLALDGAAVYVSWELYPNAADPPHGLGFVVSTDSGRTFTAPQEVPGSGDPDGGGNGSFQGRLMRKLAAHDGQLAIVNSALDLGHGSRVWLIRGRLVRGSS